MIPQDKEQLVKALNAVTKIPADSLDLLVVRPKSIDLGDWSFPCFSLAKEQKISPPDCAKKIASELVLPEMYEKVSVVGPYLNFFLKRDVVNEKIVGEILKEKFDVGKKAKNNRTLLVEYSSVNIAKTIHVGHLRTTLIGLCLDRTLRHLGYNVVSINHLGDWGTQFGFVYAGCALWGKPEVATVDSLVDLYVKASTLRKAQDTNAVPAEDADKPNVNELARDYFKRLEGGDKEAETFWRWCLDVSLEYLIKIYERLGIHFDHYTGESFYKDMVPDVEKRIKASGILEESRGALGVDLGEELGFARIFAEDGRSLYITRDMAAVWYRDETYKPEKILYVVANQQSLHFRQLKGVFEKMKDPATEKIIHIPFGFVPGMKTRGGGAISLKDFLDEAYDRALKAYTEEVQKRPEGLDEKVVAESVAIGTTYFYFLSHSNIKDFQFSWTEALNFQGDSGPYVQYALARVNSILAKASEAGLQAASTSFGKFLKDDDSHLLITQLGKFGSALEHVAETYEPNTLASYLLEVAKCFSASYRTMRVIGEEKECAEARLAVFQATKYVLHTGMTLLGMPPVERM